MLPLQIGITGGIGSGKSLVCKIFQTLGIPIYDADSRAKNIMTTDGILLSQIRKEFGDLSYHPDGTLNRTYLSASVFADPQKLDQLNRLVHPRVGLDYAQWVSRYQDVPYVLKEAALLYESGSDQALDYIIVVDAPVALRVKRVLQRDPQRSEKQVYDIIDKQWPDEEKKKRAHFIIHNDEQQLVIPQVLNLHNRFSVGHK